MSAIALKHVSKSYPGRVLFEDISLEISDGHCTVLIGENGVGKTTLLRIFASLETPDEGQVFADEWSRKEYVSQEFALPSVTAFEFLEGSYSFKSSLQLSATLGFDTSDKSANLLLSLGALSSGQKKMLMLARCLSDPNAIVMLDEPENHLDIFSREKLADLITRHKGGVLMVSHDHYLVNRMADRIVELENGSLRAFPGNYEGYLEEREKQIHSLKREWQSREQQIHRLHQTVMRMRETAKVNSDTASAYQAKKRQLEKLKEDHGRKPTTERERVRMSFGSLDNRRGKKMLTLDHLTVGYQGKNLISDTNQIVEFGERVALVGSNGTGKTTLFRTVRGEIPPRSGAFRLGQSIAVANYGQDHDLDLDQDRTPLELMQLALGQNEGLCRSRLAKLLFEQSDIARAVKTLSGGQKSRLKFGLILAQNPDLLVLDEPTNHLDPTTWDVLVDLLVGWNGTILFSSHDRTFIESVATRIWVVDEGKIEELFESLTEYLEKKHEPKKPDTHQARRVRRK